MNFKPPHKTTYKSTYGLIYQNRWFLSFFTFLCLATLISPFVSGLLSWLPGVIYVLYDTFLIALVTRLTLLTLRDKPNTNVEKNNVGLSVLISARNEKSVILICLEKLMPQLQNADEVLIVDDGSGDDTLALLTQKFQLEPLSPKELVARNSPLRVFKKSNSGKANSLNMIWPLAKNEVLVTIDADTFLEGDALSVIRNSFAINPWLAAVCGVLMPTTSSRGWGSVFEMFQQFEYIRAFLSRVAWAKIGSLLVVSGAFAAYRKSTLNKIGGYDARNLVEDYELIHRLHRYSDDHGMNWQVQVQPMARARTDVPDSVLKFLKQRQRWFGGFLQTQFDNADMVGNSKYHIGRFMLIVKAFDTLQPIFGLIALCLLFGSLFRGGQLTRSILILIFVKIGIDLIFHFWSVHIYYRWLGRKVSGKVWLKSFTATLFEPFSFQILRHLGALLGWVAFLRKNREWFPQRN